MKKNYKVEVKTNEKDYAGTDAGVYIQLIGGKCTSPELRIDNKDDNFEKGKLDTFVVKTEDVGWIYQIRIRHNDKGKDSGWFLDYVVVTDQTTGLSWRAEFNRWLAKDEGDERIDVTRDVPISDNVELSDGIISTVYIGWDRFIFTNNGNTPINISQDFTFTYQKSVSIDLSKSQTIGSNVSLDASFFGLISSKFSTETTRNVAKKLVTTEIETYETHTQFESSLPPKTALTVACVHYQQFLDGIVYSNNIKAKFGYVFSQKPAIHVFEGILSEQQVYDKISEMITRITHRQLPVISPKKKTNIPLFKQNLAVIDRKYIEEAVQKNLSAQSSQLTIKGAQLIKTPFKQDIKRIK